MANNECQFCGAPLRANASACEACGQPVPIQEREPPEVPRSYIETSELTEEQAVARLQLSSVGQQEDIPQASEPIMDTQTQAKGRNNCLIIVVVAALVLLIMCCCMLIVISMFAQYVDIDALVRSGWIQVSLMLDA